MMPNTVDRSGITEIATNLTDDAFLGGKLSILQPRRGFRAGLDSVLLAAALPVDPGCSEALFEAGCGTGVVGLAVLCRSERAILTGLDIDPDLVALARENAKRNGLKDRASFTQGDVRGGQAAMEACGLAANSFDHVFANPPFFATGAVQHAPNPQKDRANAMAPEDLERWVRFLTTLTRSKGSLTMVHRTDALPQLLTLLTPRFGDLTVLPIHPRADAPASRVLVQGRRNTRNPMSLLPGFVLHDADDGFTAEAEAVLRHGAPLPLHPNP